jgi:hypothetical protein
MTTEEKIKKIQYICDFYIKYNFQILTKNDLLFLMILEKSDLKYLSEILDSSGTSLRNEFFVIHTYKVYKLDDPNNHIEKTLFLKIGILKKENHAESIDPIGIELIGNFDHQKEALDILLMHLKYTLKDNNNTNMTLIDELSFDELFVNPK